MQLIHELSWLWKGIGIIALVSAIVLIAAFKLHKEEYKIEIACIILIVTILICIIAMIIPFTFIGRAIGLTALAAKDFLVIIGVPILYCFVAVIAKKIYIKKYGEWI